VLTGAAKDRLSQKILAAHDADMGALGADAGEYAYYPTEWISPYLERRRKVGWDLYALLGIAKTDRARMHAQHGRNYRFFGAPVGLIFSIERSQPQGSWLDYGMFLENIMIAARGRGLDTCPQAAFIGFHEIIAEQLALPAGEMVVCGMSLGYADASAPEDRLVTEREPVSAFARFLD
jgi:nitroreductase